MEVILVLPNLKAKSHNRSDRENRIFYAKFYNFRPSLRPPQSVQTIKAQESHKRSIY